VVGVGGIQALLKSGLRVRGARVVVAGSGPLLLPVAALLARNGARPRLVAEQASRKRLVRFAVGLWRTPARIADALRYRTAFMSTPYRAGHWVTRAEGRSRVEEVVITDGRQSRSLHCDLLCVGFGLVPATELPRLAGCALDAAGNTITNELQQSSQPGIYCAGETTGVGGVEAALVEGQIAGRAAAGDLSGARALAGQRNAQRAFAARMEHTFVLRAELRTLAQPDTVVCRCEDVRYGELTSCTSVREAKLYTRAGMGPCQGRVCGSAAAFLFGWDNDSVRPPVTTATVGALAEIWGR
jgi:NADPH-dependent 2,4-dienoyl-CoA reductase/sulfur reductase-like enzyme